MSGIVSSLALAQHMAHHQQPTLTLSQAAQHLQPNVAAAAAAHHQASSSQQDQISQAIAQANANALAAVAASQQQQQQQRLVTD